MKKLIYDIAKKSKILRIIFRNTRDFVNRCKYIFYMIRYRMDDKTILFEVYGGRGYTCSPRSIYEVMLTLDKFKDYKFVWAFNDINAHNIKKDDRTIIIKSGSSDYYKYLSISKYWIVNFAIDEAVLKKKGQYYVQCWHGTPLKRLRCDIEVEGSSMNSTLEIRKKNDKDASRYDYFISPSKYASMKFISSFNLKNLGKENIIIEKGYPRNDSLFNYSNKDVDNIKKKLNIPKDKKVMFYLPTFRDNQHTSGVGYTYQLEIDFKRLMDKFSNEYVILFRPHYFIANKIDLSEYKGFVYNVCDYDEINDLYIVSDMIITDYSSVFFDFANLKRPMIFFMYDIEEYKNKLRDFYIDLDELPGPITVNNDELIDVIENIEKYNKKYKSKYEEFNKKYNSFDDGNASIRVINEIFK